MQIHELIKAERIKANLSEEEMAEKLGIPRPTYQNWERNTPGVEKIRAVAKVLNLHKDYFFINSDNPSNAVDYKTINEPNSMMHEAETPYGLKGKDYYPALLEEKDKAIRKAEEFAQKMESHYEDAKIEKRELINIINNVLKEISNNLKDAASNLAHNRQDLAVLKDQVYIVSDQLEHQRVGLNLGLPGEKKPQPAPFVKKGKAASGSQQDGGKKSKGH